MKLLNPNAFCLFKIQLLRKVQGFQSKHYIDNQEQNQPESSKLSGSLITIVPLLKQEIE